MSVPSDSGFESVVLHGEASYGFVCQPECEQQPSYRNRILSFRVGISEVAQGTGAVIAQPDGGYVLKDFCPRRSMICWTSRREIS